MVRCHFFSTFPVPNWVLGIPCDAHGFNLPPGTPPTPSCKASDDWLPYRNRIEFETANLLFREASLSRNKINRLLELWAASLLDATNSESGDPPFSSVAEMFKIIDATPLGDSPWRSFTVSYNGPRPEGEAPSWMSQKYEVWFHCPRDIVCNILANPDFKDTFDVTPYKQYDEQGRHVYSNFFSANWPWQQAVSIKHLIWFNVLNEDVGHNC